MCAPTDNHTSAPLPFLAHGVSCVSFSHPPQQGPRRVCGRKHRLEPPFPQGAQRERAVRREVLPLRVPRRVVRDRPASVPEGRARLEAGVGWADPGRYLCVHIRGLFSDGVVALYACVREIGVPRLLSGFFVCPVGVVYEDITRLGRLSGGSTCGLDSVYSTRVRCCSPAFPYQARKSLAILRPDSNNLFSTVLPDC